MGLCDVQAPHFIDTYGGEAVSLTHRPSFTLYPPGRFPVLISVKGSVTPGHSAAGRIRSIEESSNLIGNRTRDLPACSVVPQPTTAKSVTYVRLASESVFLVHPVLYAAVPLTITLLDTTRGLAGSFT
jgi:hypothetical protein